MPGADEKRLTVLTGLPSNAGSRIEENSGKRTGYLLGFATKSWVDKDVFDASLDKCLERIAELHEREPLKGFLRRMRCALWLVNLPSDIPRKCLIVV